MKNRVIRLASILLVVLTACVGVSGCAKGKQKKNIEPMEAEEAFALGFDINGGQDVMPISGFAGPHPNTYSVDGASQPEMLTDEYFQAIADCGINIISYNTTDYQGMEGEVMKMLDLGEKYGIGCFIYDGMITPKRGDAVPSAAKIGARMSAYSKHPAFAGLYVVDEPWCPGFSSGSSGKLIDNCAPLYNRLAELGVVAYNNLLPVYGEESPEVYPDYVAHFLKNCNVPYIMYDYYVFDKGRTVTDYFYNMSVIRSYAEQYKIPFWTFIQAGSQWNDDGIYFDSEAYYPNEKQFDWNINTCLAYGAKGIGYFPMIQPLAFAYAKSTEWDFERNGIFGAWGNKTQWYYYAQNISAHISAIDEVLMNSVNKGVIVSGTQAQKDNEKSDCVINGTSWRELSSVNADALIGCFNYQGKTALYVVNYDMEYAQDMELKFYDKCKFSVVQNAKKTYYSGSDITLSMQAGEGVLIVFEK